MPSSQLNAKLERVLEQGCVNAPDLLDIRREVYHDGGVSINEADLIFVINDKVSDRPDDWADFYVTAMTDFLIRQTPPFGYIDESNAAWLTERIGHDGIVESKTEMALLMNVLKYSQRVPRRLEMFALHQVKMAVVEGLGALAHNPDYAQNVIDEDEVELIRAALYASGGQGGVGITKTEAEILFELNDATIGAPNHESWKDLFVSAIANCLMMAAAPVMPDAQEALRRENWLRERGRSTFSLQNIISSFGREVDTGQHSISRAYNPTALKIAEVVTGTEAAWLIERLNRDGVLNENELGVLKFIKDECPDIHHSLAPYIEKVA